jgi:hypothetical protein
LRALPLLTEIIMSKPSIAELLSASGHTAYTPELVQRAIHALYGNVGANSDTRDWSVILQSPNPLQAAEDALRAMYQDPVYLLNNVQHLLNAGYVPAQAEITYRQMADRLGFTHQPSWSQGTAYENLGTLTMDQLIALVPGLPTASIITVSAGGTYNGLGGIDDVFKSTIANLNGATIAGNAADNDILTLTTAGTVTLNNGAAGGTLSNIKVLNLADGTNTITYNNFAGFTTINGGTGDDTFIPNAALFPMVVNGGDGTDTLVLGATYAATASGSGAFASKVTGFEKLRLTGVTNQFIDLQTLGNYNDVAFSGANGLVLSNMPSNGKISLNGPGTAFTVSNAAFVGGVNDVLNVSLNDNSGAGVSFASAGITASGVETAHITVNDNQGAPTGAFKNALTWLGNSVKTINVSGNAGLTLTANSTALTTVDASGITLGGFTWTSNALSGAATVKGSASGSNTVNVNAAAVALDYTGGTGNDNVAANGTLAHTVALGNGNNSLTLSGSAILGSYTSGTGTNDTLTLASAAPVISSATLTGFENLNLASDATLTATAEQVAQFATGTITAAGTETINLSTAGTFSALSGVENYKLADGTNNFTSTDTAVSVTGGTGADTFNFTANQFINFLTIVDGGSGFDTLNIGASTTQTIDLRTKVNSVETFNVSGSTGTASLYMADGVGYLLNYVKSTGATVINMGSGGQTLNLTGDSNAATTITGGAAVDIISLQSSGGASETLIETGANMSNKTQIDKVANFSASGVDFFKTGVNASTVGSYIIGNADTGNYLNTISGGLSVVLNNTGQSYLITIQAGTAAGTYLFQNTGSDTSQFDNTDFFVQLTGAFGSISTVNMIV